MRLLTDLKFNLAVKTESRWNGEASLKSNEGGALSLGIHRSLPPSSVMLSGQSGQAGSFKGNWGAGMSQLTVFPLELLQPSVMGTGLVSRRVKPSSAVLRR